jgi:chromosome segregation ATPase
LLKARQSAGADRRKALSESDIESYLRKQSNDRDIRAKLIKNYKSQGGRELVEKRRQTLGSIKQGPKTSDYDQKVAEAQSKLNESIDNYHTLAAGENRVNELHRTPGKEYINSDIKLDNIAHSSPIYQQLKADGKEYRQDIDNLNNEIMGLVSEKNSLIEQSNHYKGQRDRANKTIEDLNNTINSNNAKIEELDKINKQNKDTIWNLKNDNVGKDVKIKDLEKSNRNWKIGTAITGAGGIGLGFGLSNKLKNKKENKEKD